MTAPDPDCELCRSPGGEFIWGDELCRVVRVADPDYPGYCRVVWAGHIKEMTDLTSSDRRHLMNVTFAVELALRRLCAADKVNLASLGNQVQHLHWHVIARHRGDRHFPAPIWAAAAARTVSPGSPLDSAALRAAIVEALAEEHGGGL